eukprot:GHRQ01003099.1.p1 GENE.GHRQ01003099.1~~GHRQ01003099.1.p1  ORF type:complete len:258 (+),score=68.57 GHRQ01003099.1:105-776(+)
MSGSGHQQQQQWQQQSTSGWCEQPCCSAHCTAIGGHRADSSSKGINSIGRRAPTRRFFSNGMAAPLMLALLLIIPSLLLLADAAAAQPCIECNQCLTASCQRICSTSCARRSSRVVTGDQCKHAGEEEADDVAESACKFSQAKCNQGNKQASAAFFSNQPVSAAECASIANWACQRSAMSTSNTPCGVYLYFGFKACSGRQFTDIYKARVVALCRTATGQRRR